MGAKQVSDGNPAGLYVGQSATDLVGFYGTTPADQPASANQAAVASTAITAVTTTAATNTTPYGYASAAQADGIVTAVNAINTRLALVVTLVNQMRTDLIELGLIKGSA